MATPSRASPSDSQIANQLARWFCTNAREFPWRTLPLGSLRDPYRVLVSEAMLQQTQTSRVVDRFERFMTTFPTVESLANAKEDRVLELWSGLGYYQRARRLQAAARAVVEAGSWPNDLKGLRRLPGVGPYTAGALASLALGVRTPVADGNVARVILRISAKPGALNDPPTMRWVWQRAHELVESANRPAAIINEAMMELGATVCTPASPDCQRCPLHRSCDAHAQQRQHEIPAPKAVSPRAVLHCDSLIVLDAQGRLLIERRPPTGLWAGLWQVPTLESPRRLTGAKLADGFGLDTPPKRIASFAATTSHRDVRCRVFLTTAPPHRHAAVWKSQAQIRRLGLSTAQRRIIFEIAFGQPPKRPTACVRISSAP